MISFVRGILSDIEENTVTVETNGVGFQIMMPISAVANLGSIGSEVKVYTHLNVKEDAMDLFGFITKDDLKLFKMLITVSGIGPKGALSILSTLDYADLRFTILSGDSKTIAKAPGIGAKTAQKLVIELKDKLKIDDNTESDIPSVVPVAEGDSVSDTILALTTLGYSQSEAAHAVRNVAGAKDMDSDRLLKEALKKLAFI